MGSIREVARRAGVGVGTVSRVLNNNKNVSDDARARIEQAMRELNYIPNELARNLYRKRSNLIGFMIPNVEHPFFGTLTRFVETELYLRGYKMMLCNTVNESDRERQYLDMLTRKMMDGIIIGSHTINVEEYENTDNPLVSFDRVIGGNIPIIRSDHLMGGRLAGEKLVRDGCRHVVQITGCRAVGTPAHLHHVAMEQVVRASGGFVETVEMPWNLFDYDSYENIAKEVLEKYPNADAIYGADLIACACLKMALRKGIRVPEDLEIVAYDGTYVTRLTSLEITCVVQNIEGLARILAEAITSLVETGTVQPIDLQLLPVTLYPGETTRT